MANRPTLAQVAALAQVSPTSASMILSREGAAHFSADTINAVRCAADQLGYQPKRTRKIPKRIVIVCPSVMNPYYATLVQAMQQVAAAQGYDTLLRMTYWDLGAENSIIAGIDPARTAGVVFCMIPQQPVLVESLATFLPVVAIGDRNNEVGFDTVDVNNFHAGELVARHLISLGHRRVMYVSTTLDNMHSARVRRLEGLRGTYQAECPSGSVSFISTVVPPIEELNVPNIEHRVGFELTRRCLREAPDVTAIVAINDMVAYGVLDALAQAGLRAPQDLSVCGFDNIYPSGFSGIALTTVDHAIEARGRSCFTLLLEKIQGRQSSRVKGPITRIEFQSELIARGTTGTPRPRNLGEAESYGGDLRAQGL